MQFYSPMLFEQDLLLLKEGKSPPHSVLLTFFGDGTEALQGFAILAYFFAQVSHFFIE
jgi:hypothetical protein